MRKIPFLLLCFYFIGLVCLIKLLLFYIFSIDEKPFILCVEGLCLCFSTWAFGVLIFKGQTEHLEKVGLGVWGSLWFFLFTQFGMGIAVEMPKQEIFPLTESINNFQPFNTPNRIKHYVTQLTYINTDNSFENQILWNNDTTTAQREKYFVVLDRTGSTLDKDILSFEPKLSGVKNELINRLKKQTSSKRLKKLEITQNLKIADLLFLHSFNIICQNSTTGNGVDGMVYRGKVGNKTDHEQIKGFFLTSGSCVEIDDAIDKIELQKPQIGHKTDYNDIFSKVKERLKNEQDAVSLILIGDFNHEFEETLYSLGNSCSELKDKLRSVKIAKIPSKKENCLDEINDVLKSHFSKNNYSIVEIENIRSVDDFLNKIVASDTKNTSDTEANEIRYYYNPQKPNGKQSSEFVTAKIKLSNFKDTTLSLTLTSDNDSLSGGASTQDGKWNTLRQNIATQVTLGSDNTITIKFPKHLVKESTETYLDFYKSPNTRKLRLPIFFYPTVSESASSFWILSLIFLYAIVTWTVFKTSRKRIEEIENNWASLPFWCLCICIGSLYVFSLIELFPLYNENNKILLCCVGVMGVHFFYVILDIYSPDSPSE